MIPYAGARAAQGLRQVVRDAGPPRHRDPATDDHTHGGIHPGETSAATHNRKTLSLRRKNFLYASKCFFLNKFFNIAC